MAGSIFIGTRLGGVRNSKVGCAWRKIGKLVLTFCIRRPEPGLIDGFYKIPRKREVCLFNSTDVPFGGHEPMFTVASELWHQPKSGFRNTQTLRICNMDFLACLV